MVFQFLFPVQHQAKKDFIPSSEQIDQFANTIGLFIVTSSLILLLRSLIQSLYQITDPKKLPIDYPIHGYITHANDSDNVRFVHVPPLLRIWGSGRGFGRKSLNIRLAGIDAPEMAHWGFDAQPYSKEAYNHLDRLVRGRSAYIIPHMVDQYGRSVASVYVTRYSPDDMIIFRLIKSILYILLYRSVYENVSLNMVKQGQVIKKDYAKLIAISSSLACVYVGGGAVYGGIKDKLIKEEGNARKRKRGMWKLGDQLISPAEFKRQNRSQ